MSCNHLKQTYILKTILNIYTYLDHCPITIAMVNVEYITHVSNRIQREYLQQINIHHRRLLPTFNFNQHCAINTLQNTTVRWSDNLSCITLSLTQSIHGIHTYTILVVNVVKTIHFTYITSKYIPIMSPFGASIVVLHPHSDGSTHACFILSYNMSGSEHSQPSSGGCRQFLVLTRFWKEQIGELFDWFSYSGQIWICYIIDLYCDLFLRGKAMCSSGRHVHRTCLSTLLIKDPIHLFVYAKYTYIMKRAIYHRNAWRAYPIAIMNVLEESIQVVC